MKIWKQGAPIGVAVAALLLAASTTHAQAYNCTTRAADSAAAWSTQSVTIRRPAILRLLACADSSNRRATRDRYIRDSILAKIVGAQVPTPVPTPDPVPIPTPAPIDTSFAACGNEPKETGWKQQINIGFNVLPGLGAMSSEGTITWDAAGLPRFRIVSDPTAPRSGSSVIQTEFPGGMPGGAAPAKFLIARANGTPSGLQFESNRGDIYTCMFVKRSANWSDNGNAGTKLFFQRPDGNTRGMNAYISYDAAQNPVACFPNEGVPYDCRRSAAGTAPDGVWHKIESLWTAGTAGVANATAKLWVDGRLVVDATGILMWLSGTTPVQQFLLWDPTYGGGINPVPATQYIWLDHLIVSVK